MNLDTRMSLKHKPQNTKAVILRPQQEIIANPVSCIAKNILWRGDIIPLIPIQRNYFILHEEQFDLDLMKHDLRKADSSCSWSNKDMHTFKWKSITLNSFEGKEQSLLSESSINVDERHKYGPTPTMRMCSYFQKIISSFNTDIYLVRAEHA